MRILIHYLAGFVTLTLYGGQVCPFMGGLPLQHLAFEIGLGLLMLFGLRLLLQRSVVEKTDRFSHVRRQFFFEFILFIAVGLGLTLFNMVFFHFPVGSGMKLLTACLTLGLFAAFDMALYREWQLAALLPDNSRFCLLLQKFFPLTRKVALFAVLIALLAAGILTLVIAHDLLWIRDIPKGQEMVTATRSVALEIAFVMSILLIHVVNVIFSYARNLRLYFQRQTMVLEEVARGRFDLHVPVTTNDEFAVIARYTNHMIEGLRERSEALEKSKDVTIRALASLAETRDNETGRHIIRTQYYVRALAEDLQRQRDYHEALNEEVITLMFKSAPLHDVGKVGIPDRILLKPGKLTDEEFEEMKKHTTYGRDALHAAEVELGENSFLRFATEIAYSHHEKWDGSGYPQGLHGRDIPLSGRIMALADVYDALISKRVYKPAFSHQRAYEIIVAGRGSHFEPLVVDAFIRQEETFRTIAAEHADV